MTQMKPVEQSISAVRELFERHSTELQSAAPAHLSVERIIRIAMTTVQRNPDLAKCTHGSLIGCLLAATQVGLEVDGVSQKAFLIPYGTKCTLIFGYKGLLELAKRAPDIKTILPPQVVYSNDEFLPVLGSNPNITHVPCLNTVRGEVTHFYVVTVDVSGERMFTVMTKNEVDKVMKMATAKNRRNDGPWFEWYEAMGLKSVIRNHTKYISSSPNLQTAIALDEQAEAGKQAIDFLDTTLPQDPAKPSLSNLARPSFKPERVAAPPAEKKSHDYSDSQAALPMTDPKPNAEPKTKNKTKTGTNPKTKGANPTQQRAIDLFSKLGTPERTRVMLESGFDDSVDAIKIESDDNVLVFLIENLEKELSIQADAARDA